MVSDESNKKTLPRPRQCPGLACQACRQRKLKCDRQKPCGSCVDAGIDCYIDSNRPPRGPKKGHLKELRTRLATLERTMFMQESEVSCEKSENHEKDSETTPEDIIFDHTAIDSLDHISFTDIFPQESHFDVKMMRSPEKLGALNPPLPVLMRADLNQLFFDRVYFFTPILQQFKFMTWANQLWPSEYHTCLQYAVWTLAASVSSQFQSTKDSLYLDTRRMLTTLETEDNPFEECYYLEHIQALLLMATYEFMQNNFSRAWATAGKAFRLVQLMKLHRLDSLSSVDGDTIMLASNDSWVVTEEKRRVFWTAFCLDRFLCAVNGLPLTFSEEVIYTRLPASEAGFHGDEQVMMPFLSDIMEARETVPSHSAMECIVFSALWGRVLSQTQDFKFDQPSEERKAELWQRHASLGTIIAQRTDLFLESHPASRIVLDPLLLFTNMMATANLLVHRQIAESIPFHTNEQQEVLNKYREEAEAAAQQLRRLSKHIPSLSPLKIHPFTPVPLFYCAVFLAGRTSFVTGCLETEIGDIIAVLRELQHFNPSCKIFLNRVDGTSYMDFFKSITGNGPV